MPGMNSDILQGFFNFKIIYYGQISFIKIIQNEKSVIVCIAFDMD